MSTKNDYITLSLSLSLMGNYTAVVFFFFLKGAIRLVRPLNSNSYIKEELRSTYM